MRSLGRLALLAMVATWGAGCLNEYADPVEPHNLRVANVDLSPERVLSRDVVLNVTVTLDNRGGGASGDVRLLAKAYDEGSGFLVAEDQAQVGVLPGETTRPVPMALTVPRQGSMRVDVTIFEDELATQRATVTARNLGVLEPEVLDTGLRVSELDFLVRGVTGEANGTRVRVQADLYLTNEGGATSESLRMQVKAREVSTQLVADVQWLESGGIGAGTTVVRSVNLSVADGYNYVFEILTWRGDVVVARNEGTVQLAPTFVKPANQEVVTTDPDVRDFLGGTPAPTAHGTPMATPEPEVPGLAGPAIALAVGLAAILIRRRS